MVAIVHNAENIQCTFILISTILKHFIFWIFVWDLTQYLMMLHSPVYTLNKSSYFSRIKIKKANLPHKNPLGKVLSWTILQQQETYSWSCDPAPTPAWLTVERPRGTEVAGALPAGPGPRHWQTPVERSGMGTLWSGPGHCPDPPTHLSHL